MAHTGERFGLSNLLPMHAGTSWFGTSCVAANAARLGSLDAACWSVWPVETIFS